MRPDHRAVEQDPLQVGVLQCLEDPLPDPRAGPAIEPAPDRIPGAQALGQVPPGGAGLGDPQDGVDEEAIILGGHAGLSRLTRQEVCDALPVLVFDLVATQGRSLHARPRVANSLPLLLKGPRICPHGLAFDSRRRMHFSPKWRQ